MKPVNVGGHAAYQAQLISLLKQYYPDAFIRFGPSLWGPIAMIMTEDAKTEKHTAGSPCGAYIETPCKFTACRVLLTHLK